MNLASYDDVSPIPKDMRDPVASPDPRSYRDGAFAIDVEVHAQDKPVKRLIAFYPNLLETL